MDDKVGSEESAFGLAGPRFARDCDFPGFEGAFLQDRSVAMCLPLRWKQVGTESGLSFSGQEEVT